MCRQLEQRLAAEQVVQQLCRGEHRPHPLQRGAHLGQLAHAVAHLGGGDRLTPRGRHRRPHLGLDEPPGGVVPTEAALRVAHDARGLVAPQAQVARAEGDDEVLAQGALTIGDGLVDDQRHADVALGRGRQRCVRRIDGVARPLDIGHEVGEDDLLHAGLAEARQDPVDVPQEHPVGADHQDALVLQREAVRVQQVGRTVQRDHGLAGARAALDHEHAGLRAADDLVLLGLDRGDDVAELTGAAAFQRGEQRRVAAQARSHRAVAVAVGAGQTVAVGVPVRARLGALGHAEVALTEQLVLDAEQLAAVDGEVPAPGEAHRIAAGGAVERLGHRGPPVHHHRVTVLIGHRQATDVEALPARRRTARVRRGVGSLGMAVDPAEHQGGIAQVEVGEPVDHGLVEHVTLVARLERAPEGALVQVAHLPRVDAAALEALISEVDASLLVFEIRMLLRHGAGRFYLFPATFVVGTGDVPLRPALLGAGAGVAHLPGPGAGAGAGRVGGGSVPDA